MLEQVFKDLIAKFTVETSLQHHYWWELCNAYSQPGRHYHNLLHLQNLYEQLAAIKDRINDWEAVLFAMFYHDIVYKPTSKSNEEKSAAIANAVLSAIDFPPQKIKIVMAMILATKQHKESGINDVDYFTDADLAILGQPWNIYQHYFQQIRAEYAMYPDLIYKPGRKKLLKQFLQMKRIFKTDHFYQKFEAAARLNISQEMDFL